jgi:2,3-bisphosphoglycerate-independent phosphoglycerate mutase
VLIDAFKYAKSNNKPVHFLGLLSDGGVHSHIDHLFGLLDAAEDYGVQNTFVHAFTDGRDVDPKSGFGFVTALEEHIKNSNTKLASITGRYYAMDRDKRWERIKLAYDALVNGIGELSNNATQSIKKSYKNDITDEFIKPIIMTNNNNNQPIANIKDGDVVIFFNFRTDRGRQLTEALTQNAFQEEENYLLKEKLEF